MSDSISCLSANQKISQLYCDVMAVRKTSNKLSSMHFEGGQLTNEFIVYTVLRTYTDIRVYRTGSPYSNCYYYDQMNNLI